MDQKLRFAGAALVAALALQAVAFAAEQPQDLVEVTVVGRSPHSLREAREDALRRAVEQGGGKIIARHSETRNFRLVHDTIVSRAAGYVRSYDELRQKDEPGDFEVEIRARVSTKKIDGDWGAVEMLIQRKRRPNLLIVVQEETQGVGPTGNAAEGKLRDIFDKVGFDLVDDETLAKIGDRDRLRAQMADDERKAAAIALKLPASYVVTGKARVRAGEPRDTYGIISTPVTADLDVKAVAADNAQLLASKSASAKRASRDPVSAARQALDLAASDVGPRVVFRMLEHWARELDAGTYVELVGTRIDTQVLDATLARLDSVEGLSGLDIVDHNPEMTTVKVVTVLSSETIARLLSELSGGRLVVTGISRGRVEFAMKAEVQRPPRSTTKVVSAPTTSVGPFSAAPAAKGGTAVPTAPQRTSAAAGGPQQQEAGGVPVPLLIGGAVALVVLVVAVTLLVARRRSRSH
jgi:hypothetical protein